MDCWIIDSLGYSVDTTETTQARQDGLGRSSSQGRPERIQIDRIRPEHPRIGIGQQLQAGSILGRGQPSRFQAVSPVPGRSAEEPRAAPPEVL